MPVVVTYALVAALCRPLTGPALAAVLLAGVRRTPSQASGTPTSSTAANAGQVNGRHSAAVNA